MILLLPTIVHDPPVELQVQSDNDTIMQRCYLIYSATRPSLPFCASGIYMGRF